MIDTILETRFAIFVGVAVSCQTWGQWTTAGTCPRPSKPTASVRPLVPSAPRTAALAPLRRSVGLLGRRGGMEKPWTDRLPDRLSDLLLYWFVGKLQWFPGVLHEFLHPCLFQSFGLQLSWPQVAEGTSHLYPFHAKARWGGSPVRNWMSRFVDANLRFVGSSHFFARVDRL